MAAPASRLNKPVGATNGAGRHRHPSRHSTEGGAIHMAGQLTGRDNPQCGTVCPHSFSPEIRDKKRPFLEPENRGRLQGRPSARQPPPCTKLQLERQPGDVPGLARGPACRSWGCEFAAKLRRDPPHPPPPLPPQPPTRNAAPATPLPPPASCPQRRVAWRRRAGDDDLTVRQASAAAGCSPHRPRLRHDRPPRAPNARDRSPSDRATGRRTPPATTINPDTRARAGPHTWQLAALTRAGAAASSPTHPSTRSVVTHSGAVAGQRQLLTFSRPRM